MHLLVHGSLHDIPSLIPFRATRDQSYSWAEDKEHCEEYGRMLQADPTKVSQRAKKRGLPQLGTLGA